MRLATTTTTTTTTTRRCRSGNHHQPRHRSAGARSRRVVATRGASVDDGENIEVRGLPEDPCDSFVCKSSPAVENTLRTVARDAAAARGTNRAKTPYAPEVTYDDGCLRFTGSEKYAKYCSYVENNLRDVEARVTSISMADDSLDEATLTWELDARNDIGRVGVDVEATYKMNLITGRVLEHRERWVVNPSRTEAQAGPLLESTRKAHALPLNAIEMGDGIQKQIKEFTKSLSQGDEDQGDYYADPNDPMKFFQQEDTSKTDLLQMALAASVIFLVTKVFETLNP